MLIGLNLCGQKFGGLTALQRCGHDNHGNALWECCCDYCGGKTRMTTSNLRRPKIRSCGCLRKPDLKGQVFGRLTVLRKAAREHNTLWACLCSCGVKLKVSTVNLQSGNTQSCGCRKRDLAAARLTIHGESKQRELTPEYQVWRAMMARCYNKNTTSYLAYGGRGIKVYRVWWKATEFLAYLLAHIGRRPSPHHSIDRIDNDGDYCPGNIRWATKSQQNRNQRKRSR